LVNNNREKAQTTSGVWTISGTGEFSLRRLGVGVNGSSLCVVWEWEQMSLHFSDLTKPCTVRCNCCCRFELEHGSLLLPGDVAMCTVLVADNARTMAPGRSMDRSADMPWPTVPPRILIATRFSKQKQFSQV
jgi:hypothetical protein